MCKTRNSYKNHSPTVHKVIGKMTSVIIYECPYCNGTVREVRNMGTKALFECSECKEIFILDTGKWFVRKLIPIPKLKRKK